MVFLVAGKRPVRHLILKEFGFGGPCWFYGSTGRACSGTLCAGHLVACSIKSNIALEILRFYCWGFAPKVATIQRALAPR